MDLSRVRYIAEATDEQLRDESWLEKLVVKLGFNDELLHEQPAIVKGNTGGLKIWQYPNQFSKYMNRILAKYPITSYLEIGCRWGGTFVLTMEYLKKVQAQAQAQGQAGICGVAVDIETSTVQEYCDMYPSQASFLKMNSLSQEFKDYMSDKRFDLVFIDGDHSYEAVIADFETTKDHGSIFVFHDISSPAVCPGVGKAWHEIKASYADDFDFYEFTDQYEDVMQSTGTTYLGMGVAVKKQWVAAV